MLRILSLISTIVLANLVPAFASDEIGQYPADLGSGVYALGSSESVVFLIVTSAGHVLVNSGYPAGSARSSNPSLVRSQMKGLGFDYMDVALLLTGHAHPDHVGGCAQIRRETGALVAVMDRDVDAVERGAFEMFGIDARFVPPCQVDSILRDGDRIELADVVLTARRTAGHTKGATTWIVERASGGSDGLMLLDSEMHYGSRPMLGSAYPDQLYDFVASIGILREAEVESAYGPHGMVLAGRDAVNDFLNERLASLSEQAVLAVLRYSDPKRWRAAEAAERAEYLVSLGSEQQKLDFPEFHFDIRGDEASHGRHCDLQSGGLQCR